MFEPITFNVLESHLEAAFKALVSLNEQINEQKNEDILPTKDEIEFEIKFDQSTLEGVLHFHYYRFDRRGKLLQ